MKRYLAGYLQEFAQSKMVLLSGPRQVGKTTLCQEWLGADGLYLNWDIPEHREEVLRKIFHREILRLPHDKMVLDEIHKYDRWKNGLKGLTDRRIPGLQIVVTGSSRLDTFQKGGDSLLGRFERLRLHPITVAEALGKSFAPPPARWTGTGKEPEAASIWERLEHYSGFPEPYLRADKNFYTRWSTGRRNLLVREDIRDLSQIRALGTLENLTLLLPEKVMSPLSVNSLREDLGVAFDTISSWLTQLEALYYCFRLSPFAARIATALKKEQKLYLWDYAQVENPAARFENMVASHLLKSVHLWNDLGYGDFSLHYYRDKQKREVDFILCNRRRPLLAVECKQSDRNVSENLLFLQKLYPDLTCLQLLGIETGARKTAAGIQVISAWNFFAALN